MPTNHAKISEVYKLIVIGESNVGKTSLLKRYARNEFSNNMLCTIGIDFLIKDYKYKDETYKIQMWELMRSRKEI